MISGIPTENQYETSTYYESVVDFMVVGIDASLANITTDRTSQTWLTLPISCMTGVDRNHITIRSFNTMELVGGYAISHLFDANELSVIQANPLKVGRITVLIRTTGIAEAVVMGQELLRRKDTLSQGATEGLKKQNMNPHSSHGTNFLSSPQEVDNLALFVIKREVWIRTPHQSSSGSSSGKLNAGSVFLISCLTTLALAIILVL